MLARLVLCALPCAFAFAPGRARWAAARDVRAFSSFEEYKKSRPDLFPEAAGGAPAAPAPAPVAAAPAPASVAPAAGGGGGAFAFAAGQAESLAAIRAALPDLAPKSDATWAAGGGNTVGGIDFAAPTGTPNGRRDRAGPESSSSSDSATASEEGDASAAAARTLVRSRSGEAVRCPGPVPFSALATSATGGFSGHRASSSRSVSRDDIPVSSATSAEPALVRLAL